MDPLWQKLRHLAQTDLFWLATQILDLKLVEDVHGPICDFFVKKDPSKPLLFDQSETRDRLLLYPRGHYKTSIDIADAIQWGLAFPNMRLSINSGTVQIGAAMLKVIKDHFTFNEKLLKLFPEYRLTGTAGTQYQFTLPSRTDLSKKEPSYSVSTARSVKAGWHYDVIKFDDMVNEQNYNTPELLQKTIDQFNDIRPLVDPGGYRDVIGTHYSFSDLYQWIKDNNKSKQWHVLQKPAATKPFGPNSTILFPYNRAGEKMFSYEQLKAIQDENEYKFNCQYLLDPTPTESASFTPELIISRTISPKFIRMLRPTMEANLQRVGRVFCTWDLAHTDNEDSDFSVGAAGWYDTDGRLYIVELQVGKWQPNELALNIIQMARNWRAYLVKVGIDKTAGGVFLELGLRNYMDQFNFYFPIEWLKMANVKKRKEKAILGLQPLLKQGQLFFASNLNHFDELVRQFTRFPHYSKRDIPDAISMLLNFRTNVDTYNEQFQYNPEPMEITASIEDGLLGSGIVG